MKQALKTALALVATLALLLGHGGLVAGASAAPAKKMGCCGDACPTHCCVEESDSLPVGSLPAVPATSSSQQLQAALIPVTFPCLVGELITAPALVLGSVPFPTSSPVPLYVRTHSFLI